MKINTNKLAEALNDLIDGQDMSYDNLGPSELAAIVTYVRMGDGRYVIIEVDGACISVAPARERVVSDNTPKHGQCCICIAEDPNESA